MSLTSESFVAGERKRSPLLLTIMIFGAIALAWVIFANIWTDWLWFKNLGFGVVFSTQLVAKIGLFFIFALSMAAIIWFNMWMAYKIRPKMRPDLVSPVVARFRDSLDYRRRFMMGVPALALGLISGLSAISVSNLFLAWRNATNFGIKDDYFGFDVSFFIFQYPWWRFVLGFLFAALLMATIGSTIIHFMTGALTGVSWRQKGKSKAGSAEAHAQRHLSILVGLGLVVWGVNTLFDRYALLVTENRHFTGVAYTDFHARMPASLIIAIIAFICALLFFANAFWLRWAVPAVSIVLMLVSSIVLSGLYPWLIQTLQVTPSGPNLERPFIQKHIDSTKRAFGVDELDLQSYDARTTVSSGQLRADAEALPSIRLMDPAVINETFEQLQQVRGYYLFPDVLDVDRYQVDGKSYDTVVAARELDLATVEDANNWSNRHTVYTHGYGLVAAYGNKRESNGEPIFLSGGIPTTGILPEAEPRIYYGERTTHYVIVGAPEGTEPIELDTPGGGEQRTETRYTYEGAGGVPIGNLFTRALYATRFAEVNILLSERVNSESRVLYDRVPLNRAAQVAPWLRFDQDAYPAVVDGKIVWILDAYTTSEMYPNSKRINWLEAISDTKTPTDPRISLLGDQVNYVRNSVKAVVDAYDGSVKLYGWDESDPILQTWMKAFPGTVLPKSEISEDLMNHLRYPQDIFKAQRQILGRYHTSNADTWYQQSDIWEVPNDPVNDREKKEPPYFLTIRWPEQTDAHYSLTSVFVPRARANLSVYMAVNADATSDEYGKLRALKLSDAEQIDGPNQTFNAINTNPMVADKLLPFQRSGSAKAKFGNLLTLPVGGGLLYVQPIYTQNETTDSYPVLRFVVVRFGQHIGIGDTLQEALDTVFRGDAGATTGEGDVKPDEPDDQPAKEVTEEDRAMAEQLFRQAEKELERADEALKAGKLGEYQAAVEQAKENIKEALETLEGR